MTQLDRIESKLDAILAALTEEPEQDIDRRVLDYDDETILTLDGDTAGKPRDDTQPL